MTSKEHLIEQHILEYESRMRRIDELYQRAHEAVADKGEEVEAQEHLREIAAQRSLLREGTDEIRSMPLDHWREDTIRDAGPMAVWDILAQKLEDFVERHEK
jgi:aryl carrier-like protein